jgi:hypothetical protein
MTDSSRGSNGRRRSLPETGPHLGARPPGDHELATRPGRRLSEGMVISADIEARLLGLRLLTLNADIALAPARLDIVRRAPQENRARGTGAGRARGGGGAPGRGLAAAARALASGADDLRAARDRMP